MGAWIKEGGQLKPLGKDVTQYLPLAGGTMQGNIDMNGKQLTNISKLALRASAVTDFANSILSNIGDPVDLRDATPRQYVEQLINEVKASSSSSVLFSLLYGTGEMEDYDIRSGTLVNAGSGWNTFNFPEPFDEVPSVFLHPQDFNGWIQVKSVSKTGFLYCLQKPSISAPTASGYIGSSTGTAPSHSSISYVRSVTLSTVSTADKIVINYFAISYGGEK